MNEWVNENTHPTSYLYTWWCVTDHGDIRYVSGGFWHPTIRHLSTEQPVVKIFVVILNGQWSRTVSVKAFIGC
jgi:hypothetical protein